MHAAAVLEQELEARVPHELQVLICERVRRNVDCGQRAPQAGFRVNGQAVDLFFGDDTSSPLDPACGASTLYLLILRDIGGATDTSCVCFVYSL